MDRPVNCYLENIDVYKIHIVNSEKQHFYAYVCVCEKTYNICSLI